MWHLTQVLVALLLACRVRGTSQDEGHYLGELQDSLKSSVTTEVVTPVNENGDTIRVETSHLAAAPTPAQQENSTTSLPSELPVSNDASHVLAPLPLPHTASQNDTTTSHRVARVPIDRQHKTHPHVHHHPHSPAHHTYPYSHAHREFGISYSPYTANQSCKTQEQVNEDISRLSHYTLIRIYGTDCDQAKKVTIAARRHNMRVFAGIYDLTGFPSSLQTIMDAATSPDGKTKDWSIFHTIAIGNELINGGKNTPSDVVDAVYTGRTILRNQGYTGAVVTVEVFSILIQYPELCHASSYCAANCHAFFDATQHPQNAGPYVLEQAQAVSDAAGGKRTIITESGWPHAGNPNGVAVPSPQNQGIAIDSLRRAFAQSGDLVLFTAFDDLWKRNTRFTFQAEQFWGIEGY